MLRRVHVQDLHPGEIELDQAGGHHVSRVLRLGVGSEVELFDDGGSVASAIIVKLEPRVTVNVAGVRDGSANVSQITIASAIPKGERADWLVEKLSELGCARWIPLKTERSVVLPEGRNKRERWLRIATEAAKQSRRTGVMGIEELAGLPEAIALAARSSAFFLSTEPEAQRLVDALPGSDQQRIALFIGPEGGWTEREIHLFHQANLRGLKLTDTILRVETAAIAAAAVAAVLLTSNLKSQI